MTTTAATTKQIEFISKLTAQALDKLAPTLSSPANRVSAAFASTALVLALPTPQSMDEASEQIDALKDVSYGIMTYARNHSKWANAVMAQCAEAVGDRGERGPASSNNGAEWYGKTWTAEVQRLLGK